MGRRVGILQDPGSTRQRRGEESWKRTTPGRSAAQKTKSKAPCPWLPRMPLPGEVLVPRIQSQTPIELTQIEYSHFLLETKMNSRDRALAWDPLSPGSYFRLFL